MIPRWKFLAVFATAQLQPADPTLDLRQDGHCRSCGICGGQWMNPEQSPPRFVFPVPFGERNCPRWTQSFGWGQTPWEVSSAPALNPKALVNSNWIIPFVLPGQIPTPNWGFFSRSRHPSSDSSSLKPRRDEPGSPDPDPDPYARSGAWDQPRDVGNTVANRSCWALVAAFPLCQWHHYPNFCMECCSCTETSRKEKSIYDLKFKGLKKIYIYFFPLHNPDAWNLYLHLSTGLIYFNPKKSSVELISVRAEF